MQEDSQAEEQDSGMPEGARPVHPDGEVDEPQAQSEHHRSSPTEGLGASATGGSPVHDADSPTEGLGAAPGGGSPVREADSPREGLGRSQSGDSVPRPSESPDHGTGASAPDDGSRRRH